MNVTNERIAEYGDDDRHPDQSTDVLKKAKPTKRQERAVRNEKFDNDSETVNQH
ncbi:hypothetical protein KIN20_004431, partial [Parelaphostrongylus tenuis]